MAWKLGLAYTQAPRGPMRLSALCLVFSILLNSGKNGVMSLQLTPRTQRCPNTPAAVSGKGATPPLFIAYSLPKPFLLFRNYHTLSDALMPSQPADGAASFAAGEKCLGTQRTPSAGAPCLPQSGAACSSTAAEKTTETQAKANIPALTATPAAPATADDELVAVIQIVHAPHHAVVAALTQESLQCLLWGSDSDVQVAYELYTTEQLQHQHQHEQQQKQQHDMQFRQQHQQPEVLQALDEGAVDVRVFFENRSGASVPFKSSNNNSRRREERGRVLVWSLLGVSAAADLVTPAAARLPDGAAAIRSAAAALEQQHQQQPLQQQLLLLQRCRAALPMRQGALWSFLLCAEVAAKLRNKVGEDVLPLAVQGVQVYIRLKYLQPACLLGCPCRRIYVCVSVCVSL